jgi:hypothetical protein
VTRLASATARPALPALARRPVALAATALAVVLAVFSNGYGFHRDELYFQTLHPALAYVDQPPLTPLIARLFAHVCDQPWAVRIPPSWQLRRPC